MKAAVPRSVSCLEKVRGAAARGRCHGGERDPQSRKEMNSCSYREHGKAYTRDFVTEQKGSKWLIFPSEGSFQAALVQKIACTSNAGIVFMGLHNRCRVVFVAFL